MIDLFGHLAYTTLVLGMWLITKRLAIGWILCATSSVTWGVLGALMDMTSIWFWSVVLFAMNLWGFYSWKRNDPI